MHEIETKVLEVDKEEMIQKLIALGAQEKQNTRLIVDWFGPIGAQASDSHPWYLRLRQNSSGNTELSWKSLPVLVGNTRQSQEINLMVSDAVRARELLEAIGLECYAHQEKDRISYVHEEWNFDLDHYPDMPPYLEIEGKSVEHIAEAITILELSSHESISEGERKLIGDRYKKNWYDLRF
jgi:adenylate cyclase class 2